MGSSLIFSKMYISQAKKEITTKTKCRERWE